MQPGIRHLSFVFLFMILVLAACSPVTPVSGGPLTEATVAVIAAQTMAAIQTDQAALFTPTSLPSATPTMTAVPTETATPRASQTPTLTSTPIVSVTPMLSMTPLPSLTPVPGTGGSGGGNAEDEPETSDQCNAAAFVDDVNISDGTTMAPGKSFTKTWRVRNIGTCTWNEDYNLVFDHGDKMGGKKEVSIGVEVEPDDEVNVKVDLEAPAEEDSYRGVWLLSDDDGNVFGLGANGKGSLTVVIRVRKK